MEKEKNCEYLCFLCVWTGALAVWNWPSFIWSSKPLIVFLPFIHRYLKVVNGRVMSPAVCRRSGAPSIWSQNAAPQAVSGRQEKSLLSEALWVCVCACGFSCFFFPSSNAPPFLQVRLLWMPLGWLRRIYVLLCSCFRVRACTCLFCLETYEGCYSTCVQTELNAGWACWALLKRLCTPRGCRSHTDFHSH